MNNVVVSVINSCSVLPDAEIKRITEALQIQVSRDYAPRWGCDASLVFVPKGSKPDPKSWWLVFLDNSDEAGALGYHDKSPTGLPIGKVFAGTDLKYKSLPSVTASHELLEMLGDPGINLLVEVTTGANKGKLYAYENCDAVEDDSYGYTIKLADGTAVVVSDFVNPSWFQPDGHAPYDFLGKVSHPFQLLSGGYISVLSIASSSRGWTQINAQDTPPLPSQQAKLGSRRERRARGHQAWHCSTAHAD